MSAKQAAGVLQGGTPAAQHAKKYCKTDEARDRKSGKGQKRKKTKTHRCAKCGEAKISDEYTERRWKQRNTRLPCCTACLDTQ